MRLVLASASPRRAELLRAAGFAFDVVANVIDECRLPDEPPESYVRRLAAEKSARALADPRSHSKLQDVVVIGADTTVVVDDEILGKPRDDDDAATMLRQLSGRPHEVMTGLSLRRGALELGRVETTTVYFAPLDPDEIEWYVRSGEGRDKAGAYAIQGLASRFVRRIEGSYANVVGLPVGTVKDLLKELLDLASSRSTGLF
jgi:nucleoside triphosphate pyrophosphatase